MTVTAVPASADMSITKTNGVTTAAPGGSTTYTITASNAGPSGVSGATVADTFPAACDAVDWTCAANGGGLCAPSGSGNIDDSVDLPATGSVTYTASCAINPAATETLQNTATINSAMVDADTGNNSATDANTLTPVTDLAVAKTDNRTAVLESTSTVYELSVRNLRPSAAVDALLTDTIPAGLSEARWACIQAESTATCPVPQTRIDDLSVLVDLAPGDLLRYDLMAVVVTTGSAVLDNVLQVSRVADASDPDTMNNQATDSNLVIPLSAFSDGFEH